jgi:parallel beta-helix repeat protein
MKRKVMVLISASVLAAVAWGLSLQAQYNAAGPGEGYDKLLVLDGSKIYTGELGCDAGKKSCIRGNGALIKLEGGRIVISGAGGLLHIEKCLITGGNSDDGAIYCAYNCTGEIINNTIVQCKTGIRVWEGSTATIKNNIIAFNSGVGIRRLDTATTTILYNDTHSNAGGNYLKFCPG